MSKDTLGTEAIRAFFTLRSCLVNHKDTYLEHGCTHCGSAATYLIYQTNTHIQKIIFELVGKYRCQHHQPYDLMKFPVSVDDQYKFLNILQHEVNFYARLHHDIDRIQRFENLPSIFERSYATAC